MLGTWLYIRKGGAVPGRSRVCRRRARVSATQRTTVEPGRLPGGSGRPVSARDRADLVVAALALLELDQPFALRVSEELREVAIAVVALGEIRVDALQRFLDDRAPDRVVLFLERCDRRREPLERLALLVGDLLRAALAGP